MAYAKYLRKIVGSISFIINKQKQNTSKSRLQKIKYFNCNLINQKKKRCNTFSNLPESSFINKGN